MSIQLITFDLDDTLWDVTPVMQDAEAALRNWLTLHAPRLGAVPVEHLWAIRARLLQAEPMLRHRLSELRRRILFHALAEAGYPEHDAQALAEAGFQVFLAARHWPLVISRRIRLSDAVPVTHTCWRARSTFNE